VSLHPNTVMECRGSRPWAINSSISQVLAVFDEGYFQRLAAHRPADLSLLLDEHGMTDVSYRIV